VIKLLSLCGFKGSHGDFWELSAYFIAHLGETHVTSMLVGLTALAALIAGKLWLKNRPVAFLVCWAVLAARPEPQATASRSGRCHKACLHSGCPVVDSTSTALPLAAAVLAVEVPSVHSEAA
jgi:hypothetical protein